MSPQPLIDGIASAVVTVHDRERHLDYYRKVLEWEVVSEVEVDAETAGQVWDTGAARITVLAPSDTTTGRIHLFETDNPTAETSPHPVGTGLGLFAIDTYVRDIAGTRARSDAIGGGWGGGPASWQLAGANGPVTVEQARLEAPEGVNLVLVVPGDPRHTDTWAQNPAAYSTELTSVVIASPSVDRSISYWGPGGLGLPVAYDATFTEPELSRLVGAPDDEEFRMAFGVGERTARLEMFGWTAGQGNADTPAHDLRERQGHGRLTGMSALGVRVTDLDEAVRITRAQGGSVVGGPVDIPSALYGDGHTQLAVVRTPDGILLEVAA